jgi:hypothetical protein
MSDVHALVSASAEMRTCRVCGLADRRLTRRASSARTWWTIASGPWPGARTAVGSRMRAPAPCFGSMHEAGMTKVRLSRLARRLVIRLTAGRADR